MAITTSTESPREKRKGKPIKPSSAITDLEGSGILPGRLAAVIVERLKLEERAKALPPEKAKRLRASDGAARLEKRERKLLTSYCEQQAECILYAPVTRNGGNSRRPMLMAVTQKRLRNIVTSLSTALLDEARKGFAA